METSTEQINREQERVYLQPGQSSLSNLATDGRPSDHHHGNRGTAPKKHRAVKSSAAKALQAKLEKQMETSLMEVFEKGDGQEIMSREV